MEKHSARFPCYAQFKVIGLTDAGFMVHAGLVDDKGQLLVDYGPSTIARGYSVCIGPLSAEVQYGAMDLEEHRPD